MGDRRMPSAVLLDLDDTILNDSGSVDESWRHACASHADRLAPLDAAVVVDAIRKTSKWFWDDPDRHREGRLQLDAARREVVRLALRDLGVENPGLLTASATPTATGETSPWQPLPDAIETVRWLRESGRRLALLTNGAAVAQRTKDCALRDCRSVRRHSRRGGIGIRKARRARLSARAERARREAGGRVDGG